MVKIKTKKQLSLPQLIQWAIDNKIEHRVFVSNPNFDGVTYKLGFDKGGDLYFEEALTPTLLFTVEVEETISEDTEFKRLVYIDDDDDTVAFSNFTIRELKDNGVKEFHAYIDGEFKCIWRNGKLI